MTWIINPFRRTTLLPVVPSEFWRMVTLGSDWSSCSIAEVEMAATIGGVDLCTSGTGSVINGSGNTTLFDNNIATFGAAGGNNHDQWVISYNFPSPVLIQEFRIQARDALSAWREAPKAVVTQVSFDGGSTWNSVTLWFNATAWSSGETRSVPIGGVVMPTGLGRSNARGWRIQISAVNGATLPLVGELVFAATPGGATLCTGGTPTSSAGSTFVDRQQDKAFDNNTATRWAGVGASYNAWRIGYCTQEPMGDVVEVRVTNALAVEAAQAPSEFEVQYSEDLFTWTTVATITGQSGWGTAETRAFAI